MPQIPKWLPRLYGACAVALVPWIIYLYYSLPFRHPVLRWSLIWVGYDLVMMSVVLLVVYLARKRSARLNLALMSLATLLVADAWFDILTSNSGYETGIAVALAALCERPLAALSLRMALKIGR